MSRAQRRATRTTARSRRVPARAAGGRQIPWVPIAVVLGAAAVIGLVAFLIIQAQQGKSIDTTKWQTVEADASPSIPGEFVNLQQIYGGKYGSDAPNTNAHVKTDVDYKDKQGLPPAGGPHWGATACPSDPVDQPAFCGPVAWGVYTADQVWNAESLVHSMEHGGVVVWYNTEDQSIIDNLLDWGVGNDDKLLVVTPFPDMDQDTVAITSWGRRLAMKTSELDTDELQNFLNKNQCRFDPEGICKGGSM
jgi:hypothetical protein